MFDPLDTPATTSPLHADAWLRLLQNYPEPSLRDNILGMIHHGAKLGYDGPLLRIARPASAVRNLPMNQAELSHVRRSIQTRVAKNQTRAVSATESKSVVFSPIGAVPKQGGKFRTINHLSWPRGGSAPSVNGGINVSDIPMAYESLSDVYNDVRQAHALSERVELWKADLTDAFYHVVAASKDVRLLGFHLDGAEYLDLTLNFGGRSSPFLFNLVAKALHWICESLGMRLNHYLDDSFGVCPLGQGERCLELFRAVSSTLGVAVSPSKTVSGSQLEVLGVLVDCERARAWISDEKRARIIMDIDNILSAQTVPTTRLQSTAGSLVFVTRVCPAGRAFLRRVFDAMSDGAGPWSTMSSPLREEFHWWRARLVSWDGCTLLSHTLPATEVWTDAASTVGLGGHLGPKSACTEVFALPIPARHQGKDIMFLEALALLTALRRWEDALRDRMVTCFVDNTVLASAIRSGSCRHGPTQVIIREIFGLAMAAHMTLVPSWVASAENDLADAMSRFDFTYVLSRYPSVALPADARTSPAPASPA